MTTKRQARATRGWRPIADAPKETRILLALNSPDPALPPKVAIGQIYHLYRIQHPRLPVFATCTLDDGSVRAASHWKPLPKLPDASRTGRPKLTPGEVDAIRKLYGADEPPAANDELPFRYPGAEAPPTYVETARMYGVSPKTIRRIALGLSWRNL